MELLSSPRNEYLLDASFKSLHADCDLWLRQLDFWREEIMFFKNLLHHKRMSDTSGENLDNIEKELQRLHSGTLSDMRATVSVHERLLGAIEKSSATDHENYRNAHRTLFNEMFILHNEIRTLRNEVFAWISR